MVKMIAGHGSMAQTLEKLMDQAINGVLFHLPESLQSLYAQEMVDASRRFATKYSAEIDAWWEKFDREFEAGQKTGVDITQQTSDSSGVCHSWNDLKTRLKRATAAHGKKAEAAEAAGVHRSNLNRWLDDNQEPGAEATFKLLAWVEGQEKKQKRAASGETPATPATQPMKEDRNERQSGKSKSGRGKESLGERKKSTPRKQGGKAR